MRRRLGRREAMISFVSPAILYATIAFLIGYSMWPYFYIVKNETLIAVAAIGVWRYTLQLVNYVRAIIYAYSYFPKMKRTIEKIPFEERFPKHIYFIIPSYKEEPWVSVEVFQSLFADLNNIPSSATLLVSTGSDFDDQVIQTIYDSHPNTEKIDLVFQRQKDGKRIAMGHSLRAAARRYNDKDIEENSVSIFMDGDSYLPLGTLEKTVPFLTAFPDLGAVTTDEIAYIYTKSNWYRDWFNLKFGQRHVLFQSQSLSRKILTLTGRFSLFRSKAVLNENFISMIENDIILDKNFGKIRFLMGDDKSSWYNLLLNGWNLLYIPDAVIYSLESRDGKFLDVSQSLPYRWYGNTLRNNQRARQLKNQPLFIRYLFWDQIFLMWTSLVGIVGAILLSIFVNLVYLPVYVSWVLFVRIFQMFIVALSGHPVTWRTIPLMLYSQWVGAYIKIKSFHHLHDQKWSKGGNEVQTADGNFAPIKDRLAASFSKFRIIYGVTLFLFLMMTVNNSLVMFPSRDILNETFPNNSIHADIIADDNRDDSVRLNEIIREAQDFRTIILPAGVIDLHYPIMIERGNITLRGSINGTTLLSHLNANEKAVIYIKGKKGAYLGTLSSGLNSKISFTASLNKLIKEDDILLIEQANDKKFVQETLGSKRWYKKYPTLRSEIVKVVNIVRNENFMAAMSKSEIDKGAKIFRIDSVANVTLRQLTVDTLKTTEDVDDIYENIDKASLIDSIKFEYASNCKLDNVKIRNSGSNPLTFERSYGCMGKNISIDGAYNKGKKGNGYLRFNKTFRTHLEDVTVKDIRHIVFQWSSAYNKINGLITDVDINFHGGATHHNVISDVTFNVNNETHKWGEVYFTPTDASWAPPDYNTNKVIEHISKGTSSLFF